MYVICILHKCTESEAKHKNYKESIIKNNNC